MWTKGISFPILQVSWLYRPLAFLFFLLSVSNIHQTVRHWFFAASCPVSRLVGSTAHQIVSPDLQGNAVGTSNMSYKQQYPPRWCKDSRTSWCLRSPSSDSVAPESDEDSVSGPRSLSFSPKSQNWGPTTPTWMPRSRNFKGTFVPEATTQVCYWSASAFFWGEKVDLKGMTNILVPDIFCKVVSLCNSCSERLPT